MISGTDLHQPPHKLSQIDSVVGGSGGSGGVVIPWSGNTTASLINTTKKYSDTSMVNYKLQRKNYRIDLKTLLIKNME